MALNRGIPDDWARGLPAGPKGVFLETCPQNTPCEEWVCKACREPQSISTNNPDCFTTAAPTTTTPAPVECCDECVGNSVGDGAETIYFNCRACAEPGLCADDETGCTYTIVPGKFRWGPGGDQCLGDFIAGNCDGYHQGGIHIRIYRLTDEDCEPA